MSDPKNPKPGDLVIDASDLASFLVDLPPGGMRGLRPEKEAFDEVREEVLANQPKHGDAAGIAHGVFNQFVTIDAQIGQIDRFVQSVEKLAEVLVESRARLIDQRERIVAGMAESAERQAKTNGDDGLLARYAKTRSYRSQTAVKAAQTRRRNEAARPEGEPEKPEPAKPVTGEPTPA